ncbi:MAG: hypothetical protein K2Q09_05295 [Phycisphaerales bacterium]|nr:hypothetical protein [Phycisphaerales bacterium]
MPHELKAVEDCAAQEEAQDRLVERLQDGATVVQCEVGTAAATSEIDALWHEELGFWAGLSFRDNGGMWNPFGLDRPVAGQKVEMVVQINPAVTGNPRLFGAFFSFDDCDRVWLCHKLKVQVQRHAFPHGTTPFQFWSQTPVVSTAFEDGRSDRCALVSCLESDSFLAQTAAFVRGIHVLKTKLRAHSLETIAHGQEAWRSGPLAWE